MQFEVSFDVLIGQLVEFLFEFLIVPKAVCDDGLAVGEDRATAQQAHFCQGKSDGYEYGEEGSVESEAHAEHGCKGGGVGVVLLYTVLQ
jgi:hypothetical protein